MKKLTRLISLLLALMMVLSLLPAAYAEGEENAASQENAAAESVSEGSSESSEEKECGSESVKEEKSEKAEAASGQTEKESEKEPDVDETEDSAESAEKTTSEKSAEESAEREDDPADESGVSSEEQQEPETASDDSSASETDESSESIFVPCTKTEGCTLADGHEGECVLGDSEDEEVFAACTKTEGCTLADGHEGECVLGDSEDEEVFAACTKTDGCTLADGHEGECVLGDSDDEEVFAACTKTEGCTLADGHEGACVLGDSDDEEAFTACTKTEGCILADGHEGECVLAEEEFIPCTKTEGCILADGHEGECVLAEEENGLPYGFPGMPEGFTLSKSQLAQKQDLVDRETVAELSEQVAGQHYVKDEVLLITDEKDFAKTAAEAYDATLESFNGYFAVLRLNNAGVLEAVTVAADLTNNMPAVTPNYIKTIEPIHSSALSGSEKEDVSVPTSDCWKDYANSDPLLNQPSSGFYQWQHDMVNSYEAWTTTKGSSSVKVAVIDSGADSSHPDLENVEVRRVKDLTTEPYGDHGTHVAGIICATLGNKTGGAGIAPNVKVYSYRVSDSSGSIDSSNEAQAIYDAVNNEEVDIINLSLGGYPYDTIEADAIEYAISEGVSVVAAMGNSGSNSISYPAGYDGVIGVGAVTPSGKRAYFSNYGSWCDISAPGVSILSTVPDNSYDWLDGTSQAAPIVSGVLALYMSKVGHVSPSTALKKLKAATNACSSSGMGAGIIDASKLFSEDKTKPVLTVSINGYAITNLKSAVPYDAEVTIEAAPGAQTGGLILYTLDGKTPALKNGEVSVGYEYTAPLPLSEFAGKKVTIKAACVNEYGVLGSVASLTVNVSLNPSPSGVSVLLNGKDAESLSPVLTAGKSLTFSAAVLPSDTLQSVTWSVQNTGGKAPGAKISKGKLTTKSTDSGEVTVTATSSVLPSVSQSVTVQIKQNLPVTTIALDRTKGALSVKDSMQLTVTALMDKKKTDLRGSSEHVLCWTSSNPKVATVDETGLVTAVGSGKATITCSVLDGGGKKATCTVTCTQAVESITIAGIDNLAAGKSYTFTASVSPATATNKSVVWSCTGSATINKKGKLTIKKGASGEVTVRASAADGSGVSATFTVSVVNAASYLSLTADGAYTQTKTGITLQAWTLNSESATTTKLHTRQLRYRTDSTVTPVWTSNNSKVASVDQSGLVTGISYGTATVTCTIPDGTGRKATATVTVGAPASSITVESSAPRLEYYDYRIAYGKTVTHTISFGDSYGKVVTNTANVEWNLEAYNEDGEDVPSNILKAIVWSDAKRSLTVKKTSDVVKYLDYHCLFIKLTAHTTDGTNLDSEEIVYEIVPPTTYIKMSSSTWKCDEGLKYAIYPQEDILSDIAYPDFTITSSNPNIVSYVGAAFDNNGILQYYIFYCAEAGKATLTIKANDCSGKSCKLTILVD